MVVCTAIIVAVLLADETRMLSISVVDNAALAIHEWTLSHVVTVETYGKRWWALRLLVALMSSFYAVKYSRHKYVHVGNYAARDAWAAVRSGAIKRLCI